MFLWHSVPHLDGLGPRSLQNIKNMCKNSRSTLKAVRSLHLMQLCYRLQIRLPWLPFPVFYFFLFFIFLLCYSYFHFIYSAIGIGSSMIYRTISALRVFFPLHLFNRINPTRLRTRMMYIKFLGVSDVFRKNIR